MIAVVGHTAIDHLFRVPKLPGRHNSTYITEHSVYFGGGAANIAAGIATLGERCQLVSLVGDDFPGSDYDLWLQRLGVVQDVAVVKGARTATAYVFTDDAGDQETFFEWGASAAFSGLEAPALDFVHMATADPDFNVRVAQKSRFASFDPGQDLLRYTPEQLGIILADIDILFSNNHEMDRMCGMLGLEREDLIASVPMTVITRGAEGSILCMDGEEARSITSRPSVWRLLTRPVPVTVTGQVSSRRSGGAATRSTAAVLARWLRRLSLSGRAPRQTFRTAIGCLHATGRSLANLERFLSEIWGTLCRLPRQGCLLLTLLRGRHPVVHPDGLQPVRAV